MYSRWPYIVRVTDIVRVKSFGTFFFFFFLHTFTLQLLNKPWSQVSSLLLPVLAFNFYRA